VSTPGSSSCRHFPFRRNSASSRPRRTRAVRACKSFFRRWFSVVNTPGTTGLSAPLREPRPRRRLLSVLSLASSRRPERLSVPLSPPSQSSALADWCVTGLDQSSDWRRHQHQWERTELVSHGAPGAGFRAGQPCSLRYGQKLWLNTPNAPRVWHRRRASCWRPAATPQHRFAACIGSSTRSR
jgi:hypothetical protein